MLASFNVEQFGTDAVQGLDGAAVRARVDELARFTRFDHAAVDLEGAPALVEGR